MQFSRSLIYFAVFTIFFGCAKNSEKDATNTEHILIAEEELRIGTVDGDENYMFGTISHIALGREGRIFAADHQVPIVRMYDKEGKFIKNVGREGRGPGEYTRLSGLKAFQDGRLAIWNASLMNINVYDPAGEYLETHTVNSTLHAPDLFEVGKDGEFYVKTRINRNPDEPNWQYGWIRVSPEGEVIDTLEVPRDEVDRPLTFVLFTAQGSNHAFITWPRSTISSEGYVVYAEDNNEYEIEFLNKGGSEKAISREFDPVTLHTAEKEQWQAWTDAFARRGAENVVPDYKPAFRQIFTDREGRIWIWKYVKAEQTEKKINPSSGPESNWWEPPTFDVFLPDGSYYGTVKLPLNANFKDAKGDIVVAVVIGDKGEEYVVRYRLEEVEQIYTILDS